jgi:hypothetical protein
VSEYSTSKYCKNLVFELKTLLKRKSVKVENFNELLRLIDLGKLSAEFPQDFGRLRMAVERTAIKG